MCTEIRFSDGEGNMYLARNLDWSTRYGERVVVTPAGFPLPYSFLDDAPAAHAVIGMAVVLDNYPLYFDCGNDAGLGVAGLNFPGVRRIFQGTYRWEDEHRGLRVPRLGGRELRVGR